MRKIKQEARILLVICYNEYVLLSTIRGVKGLEKVFLMRKMDIQEIKDVKLLTYLSYMRFKISLCEEENFIKSLRDGEEITLSELKEINTKLFNKVNELIPILRKILLNYINLIKHRNEL